MKERERLIELIEKYGDKVLSQHIALTADGIADYLLANGVIVLPCKIGESVWGIATPCGGCKNFNEPMKEEFIEQCRKCKKQEIIQCDFDYDLIPEFNKTVFLTKEEAEAALRKEDEGK